MITLYYALRAELRDRYAAWQQRRHLRAMSAEQFDRAISATFRACRYACDSDCQALKVESAKAWEEITREGMRRIARA